jgi:hypothetical protein
MIDHINDDVAHPKEVNVRGRKPTPRASHEINGKVASNYISGLLNHVKTEQVSSDNDEVGVFTNLGN